MLEQSPLKILCIDDETEILNALKRVFRKLNADVTLEQNSTKALTLLQSDKFDIIISDMRMPIIDGATVLAHALLCQPRAIRIMLTGYSDQEATIRSINESQLFAYVQKPWDNDELIHIVEEAQRKLILEDEQRLLTHKLKIINKKRKIRELNQQENLEKLQIKLQQKTTALGNLDQQHHDSLLTSIQMLAQLSSARCGLSPNFIESCRHHCSLVARKLSLSSQQQHNLDLAAQLFLVGKIQLTDDLARKPNQGFTAEQMRQYCEFTHYGADYLMPLLELKESALVIYHLLERIDGKGSPNGLTQDSIPIESRVLAIVNYYLHAIDPWSGSLQLTVNDAQKKLQALSDSHFDSHIVTVYLSVLALIDQSETTLQENLVTLNDIKPGHCLSRDLTTPTGVLLLAKNTAINENHLYQLHNYEKQRKTKLSLHSWADIHSNYIGDED